MANIGTQMTEAFAGLDRTSSSSRSRRGRRRGATEMDRVDNVRFEDVSFSYVDGEPVRA